MRHKRSYVPRWSALPCAAATSTNAWTHRSRDDARVLFEAIRLTRSHAFDLILTDIRPGIDGMELLRRLRSERNASTAPIIAVTALAMQSDRDRALVNGFDGYITKPIDPRGFAAQIEAFLTTAR